MGCKSSKPVRVVPGVTIVGEEPLGEGEPLGEEPLGEGEPLGEEPLGVAIVGEPLGEEPLGVTIVGEPLGEEPLGVAIVGVPLGEEPLGEEPLGEEPLGEEPLGEVLEWHLTPACHTNETLREWVKRWCSGERVAAPVAGESLVVPGECERGVPARSTGLPHISKWDTSAVTDMSSLFKDQKDFNDDISGWDTGAVTTMSRMFEGAS